MARIPVALAPLLAPLLATGCGGFGLDPLAGPGMDTGALLDELDAPDPVDVPLSGLTYATPMAELQVLQPAGLQALLGDQSEATLLFHVLDEDLDKLTLAMTMGDAAGDQDACTPVFVLPEADWTTNPELEIVGGRTEIEIANQPVALESLGLEATVRADGGAWESVHIRTLLDTRDLLGGSLPEGTDVCELVENMDGECRECADGELACAVLELQLQTRLVETDFDPQPSGC